MLFRHDSVKPVGMLMKTIKAQGAQTFSTDFVSKVFAPKSFSTMPEVIEATRKVISATAATSMAANLLAIASRTDTSPSLHTIRVPTLILVGEKDTLTPLQDAQNLKNRIQQSELHIIPDAGHMSNLENPQFFNEKLSVFLNKIDLS